MTRPHRVFLTTDAVGGVWTYTLDVARGFAAKGAIVDIVTLGPSPDAAQREQAAAIPHATLIESGQSLEWCMAGAGQLGDCATQLAALAAAREPASIHLHSPSLIGHAEWPAPVLATLHSCVATWWRAVHGNDDLPEVLAWQAAATRLGLNRAACVIAPGRAFAAAIRDAYALSRPVAVVPNGRPAAAFPPRAGRSGALAAGRLWDQGKNIAAVDRAAARLAAALPEMPVLAAGALEGPNGARIALRHARPLGVMSAGPLAELMAGMAVFVAPAFYEPFGLAILEAAQAGMALVLGDIPTLRESWNDAAVFVDPADDAALAAALARLHAEPEHAATMGAKAQARAAHYPIESTVSALWDTHQRLARLHALEAA
jgi:glycosyltransferase involved in cell wall biosynthesis